MAVRDTRRIRRALQAKGFQRHEGGNHEKYILQDQDGKPTAIFTLLSRGSTHRQYSDKLLSRMARQLKLSKHELLDLIDCNLQHTEYLKQLRRQNVL